MTPIRTAFCAALLIAVAQPALADDSGAEYVFDAGAGLMAKPRYPGSDEVIAVPFPIISVSKFFVPGIGEVIDADKTNATRRFSIYPSFNFIGRRESSDSNELEGMKDVDWALELGVGLAYRHDWLRGFVEVRQGFNGYSGQVADFGLDVIANPTEDLQLMVGPRASWGSENYMKTYFGISQSDADDSPIYASAYEADAGFNSLGIAATASYALTEDITFHMQGGWDRLIGDAGDSPIVKEGSENQFYGGAGFTYRFRLDID